MSPRSSGGRRPTGKLGLKLAIVTGIVATLVIAVIAVVLVANVGSAVLPDKSEAVDKARLIGLLLALLGGVVLAITAFVLGSGLGQRLLDLGLSVRKLGRGTEVRVRASGNDEIAALGRAIQFLATDLASLTQMDDEQAGMAAAFDPQLREFRDRTLPDKFEATEGLELDGVLSAGSRGGLDYFDVVSDEGRTCLFVISPEGHSAAAAVACRMAFDELGRALRAGATTRKALAHTNRVMHKSLPRGTCAKASVLEIEKQGDVFQAKVYQANARSPVLLCVRGEVEEIEAEGLALGLDEGAVFEKGLQPQKFDLSPGMRFVLLNDAGYRHPDLLDQVEMHAPKHTVPFMNMVLSAVEDAEEEGLREDVVLLTVKKS